MKTFEETSQSSAPHSAKKTATILINLGTPRAPDPESVGEYLKEFLMDPYVIDLPWLLRTFLVKGIIVPKRKSESAHAYSKVWTDRGSPLLFHSQDLAKNLQNKNSDNQILLAMRYGSPSIAEAFEELESDPPDRIQIFSLYPQSSRATTGSIEAVCVKEGKRRGIETKIEFVKPFYDQRDFLEAWEAIVKNELSKIHFDHVLFSFHGLPQKYVKKYSDPYPEQCMATAHRIAERVRLSNDKYSISFQSRLGRAAWLQPYTSDRVVELARSGCKSLLLISPSFVADCLETIEELGMQAKEQFILNGGENFTLAPSLNSSPRWIQTIQKISQSKDRFQDAPLSI